MADAPGAGAFLTLSVMNDSVDDKTTDPTPNDSGPLGLETDARRLKTPKTPRRRPALLAFSGLAVLFCAGVIAQVFLAGLGLLVDPAYLSWHSMFVHLLEGLLLIMLVLGVIARAGWRPLALTVGLYALIAAQYAFIHGLTGPFRALHAVNAFALFVVSWQIAKQAAARGWFATLPNGANALARVNTVLATAVLLVAVASVALAGSLNDGRGSTNAAAASAELPSAAMAAEGERVYAQNCAACHGDTGQGRVGPALAGNDDLANRSSVIERVTDGSGIMPPFESSLSPAQIEAVVLHVRSSWGNDF